MSTKKYPQVYDNEWVQPQRKGFRFACCDCGLIHEMEFRVHLGKPQFRARRNNRATATYRRYRHPHATRESKP